MRAASTLLLRRKFDLANVLATIVSERIDRVPMVQAKIQRILDHDDEMRCGQDSHSVLTGPVRGSALPGALAQRFMEVYGEVVYSLCGSAEVAWVAIASRIDLPDAPGTAGRPPRNTEIAILGDDDRPVPTGETGRIFVSNSM